MLGVTLPQVPRRTFGHEEQRGVLVRPLDTVVGIGERDIEVVRHVLVEVVIFLLRDLRLVAHPQGRAAVDLLVLGRCILGLFGLLAVELLAHLHRQGEMVGELADDAAQTPGIQELLLVVLQVQDDVGAASGFFERLQGKAAAAVGLPTHTVLGTQPGATRDQGHLVRDDEGRIETDTELADQLAVFGLIARERLDESARAGAGDTADGVDHLLAAEPDPVVRYRERAGLLVDLDPDAQIALAFVEPVVAQRLEAQLLGRVGGVGDQLAQKDLLVRIQRPDDEIQHLADLGLELQCFFVRFDCHRL